ncbi:MAG: hypothetical protein V3T31_07265, partial [candidate division Zixibacteria bacterium]
LADAISWQQKSVRNCQTDDMIKAMGIRDLASTQGDGQVYYHVLDDIEATIDRPSLHYAGLKVAAAMEKAERSLLTYRDSLDSDISIELTTPFGKIALFSRDFDNEKLPRQFRSFQKPASRKMMSYDASDCLLIVDFGRDIAYHGSVAAAINLTNPISALIDLAGDDVYGDSVHQSAPSAGVGLLGIGILLDSEGDDQYYGTTYAQGAGLFGIGALLDRSGNDRYQAEVSAQGCGYFGIGLCFDGTGDDEFYLYGDGQGMGGVGGGVGVLASFSGNDKYTAEPFADRFDRGDYHSEHKINGNAAQGVGFGRRGDGSDGHAWAGGLGAIIDIEGNDHYLSGNWSLGVGYWFATGIVVDRSGDDIYESCYFTQASGAHYCNGILIDEGGNDKHELYETAGAALGFGWDYTNALLINIGGDDIYRAKMISIGLAQIRSVAFLIDIGGDDRYFLGKGTPGLGEASWRAGYDRPLQSYAYNSYSRSFGGFIDIGGHDIYRQFTDSTETDHPYASDRSLWLRPAKSDSLFGDNNFGVGIDIDSGFIPELTKWE